MSKLGRRPAPPAFVRWLQLLFATVFSDKHRSSWSLLVRRRLGVHDRARSARSRRVHSDDFAPTQLLKRIEEGVDERWSRAGVGVDVSEEDFETLPAELREALLGERRRAPVRAESARAAQA